jgi:uncharacterized tellurite resistance protein B-like protein
MSSPQTDHAALVLTESERIDYLTAVASLVLADQEIDERETARLRGLCKALGVSAAGEDAVIASASAPNHKKVAEIIADIKKDNALSVALLTDALVIVFADGKLAQGETETVATLARALSVPTSQAVLIARHVEKVLAAEGNEPASGQGAPLSKDLATGLTADSAALPKAGPIRWLYKKLGR